MTFKGLKVHKLMYGIVISIVNLNITMMDKGEVVKCLEAENNIKAEMIVKITPL